MRLYQLLSVAVLLNFCGSVASSDQRSPCQNCVTFLADLPKHQAALNGSRSIDDRAQDACSEIAASQRSMCVKFLQAYLPGLDARLQDPVRV